MHKLFAWQVSKVAAREYAFGSSSIQGRRPSQEDRALGCNSMLKVPPWQCPGSAPVPPKPHVWRLWTTRHSQAEACPLGARELPSKSPIPPPLTIQELDQLLPGGHSASTAGRHRASTGDHANGRSPAGEDAGADCGAGLGPCAPRCDIAARCIGAARCMLACCIALLTFKRRLAVL